MNKKGFTLVELLAVVAILSILVIIALPNVMGMFNEAKKNSFTTELKQVYKVAEQTWISESMFSTGEKVYSRCSGCTGKSLDLSGRDNLEYYIKIDKSGKVSKFYATDGTYQFSYEGDLLATYIKDVETVAELDESDVMNIDSSGAYYGDASCRYKIVCNNETFIQNNGGNEACFTPVSDNYEYDDITFDNKYQTYNSAYDLIIEIRSISEGGYLRIYSDESKTNLLLNFDYTQWYDNRILFKDSYLKFITYNTRYFVLGKYNYRNLTIEKSNVNMSYTYGTNIQHKTSDHLWITDSKIVNSFNYGAHFDNCDENDVCGGNTFYEHFK